MVVRKWSWWRGISCLREPPVGASWYQTCLKKTARFAFKAFGCVAAGPRGSFLSEQWLSWKQGQRIPALCGAVGQILPSRSLPGNSPGERGFVLSAHPLSSGSLGYGAVGIVDLFWVCCIGWSRVSTREGDWMGNVTTTAFLGCPFSCSPTTELSVLGKLEA